MSLLSARSSVPATERKRVRITLEPPDATVAVPSTLKLARCCDELSTAAAPLATISAMLVVPTLTSLLNVYVPAAMLKTSTPTPVFAPLIALTAATGTPLEPSTMNVSSPAPPSKLRDVSLLLAMEYGGGLAGEEAKLTSRVTPPGARRT